MERGLNRSLAGADDVDHGINADFGRHRMEWGAGAAVNLNGNECVKESMNAKVVFHILLMFVLMLTGGVLGQEYQPADGQALAKKVREAMPPTNLEGEAILRTRERSGEWAESRLTLSTQLLSDHHWVMGYSSNSVESANPALFIEHKLDKRPRYLSRLDAADSEELSRGSEEFTRGLAGSEFTPLDLGLDFLHWPEQGLIKHRITMRRSRPCFVLESSKPDYHGAPYSRVVSWIDREHLVLMRSEAYDVSGKLLKTFEPDDITKVNGEWRVKTVEIRNRSTKRRSELEFLYD